MSTTRYVTTYAELSTKEVTGAMETINLRPFYHERANLTSSNDGIDVEFTLAAGESTTISPLPAAPYYLMLTAQRAADSTADTDLLAGDPLPVDVTGPFAARISEAANMRFEADAESITIENLAGAETVRVRVMAEGVAA